MLLCCLWGFRGVQAWQVEGLPNARRFGANRQNPALILGN